MPMRGGGGRGRLILTPSNLLKYLSVLLSALVDIVVASSQANFVFAYFSDSLKHNFFTAD